MGYSFIGYHRKKDNDCLFYEECMYAYQPVFKECFGKEISDFSGRVTKNIIEEFEIGLNKFKSNTSNSRDYEQFPGYLSNITYSRLCDRLTTLLNMMKSKQVNYLSIG